MQHRLLKEGEKQAVGEKSNVSKKESMSKQKNERLEDESRVTNIENKAYVVPAL